MVRPRRRARGNRAKALWKQDPVSTTQGQDGIGAPRKHSRGGGLRIRAWAIGTAPRRAGQAHKGTSPQHPPRVLAHKGERPATFPLHQQSSGQQTHLEA